MAADPVRRWAVAPAPRGARRAGRARLPSSRGIAAAAIGYVHWVARHWLALMAAATAAFLALPFAAPVLAMTGHERISGAIYFVYRITCHQLPHRSWFIGGQSATVDWETARAHLGLAPGDLVGAFHQPITDPVLGYQVAFCQRDVATFAGLLLAVVVFGAVRDRWRVPPMPIKLYVLALVPLALDGGSQLLGLRDSSALLRSATGLLFGLATGWLVLPQLELGFREISEEELSAPAAPPGHALAVTRSGEEASVVAPSVHDASVDQDSVEDASAPKASGQDASAVTGEAP